MSSKSFRVLLAVVVGLVLVMWGLEIARERNGTGDGRMLLPGLAGNANAANEIVITLPDEGEDLVLKRDGDRWTVASRGGYPADVATLRQLVVALSDAEIVEQKTSDPGRYARLGVAEPGEEDGGIRIVIRGDGFSHGVILGDSAQGDYRYARVPGDATSYLVDRNPELPESAGDWLQADILDIGADRIRRVTITHADGERIVIDKKARELTDFTVLDVPEGRELSYATVGNGIAGALGKLTLDDVRADADLEPATTTEFLTWDGLRILASVAGDGDERWISFDAEATDSVPEPAAGDEPAGDSADEAVPTAAGVDVETLTQRLDGWEYRIADYKAELLIRRWEDLLKDAAAD